MNELRELLAEVSEMSEQQQKTMFQFMIGYFPYRDVQAAIEYARKGSL
jgi:hypothetical protein